MNSVLRKFFIALFFIGFVPLLAGSQELTGIWRGYFITESGDHYRLEFQVAQNKSLTVTGVSYSYLDTRFYGKATMIGNFFKQNGAFNIQELRTVEVKNLGGGGTCLMNYKFTYAKSGKEEFLEGTYLGKSENRKDPKNNGKWGDCGSGTVVLRRVVNSDFYVEPFLRDKINPKKVDTAVTKPVPKTTIKTPSKPVVHKPTNNSLTKKKPPVKKSTIVVTAKKDSIKKQTTSPIVIDKPVKKAVIPIPTVTRSRNNELVQTLIMNNDEISIRLYDNGEVDGDTISVYLDGQPIISNKGLSTVPITFKLKMDEDNPEHTLVMVAENLGRIPPNTSLMIVQDGEKRYQVSITSTEQKNAMVRFRFQKSP